MLLIAQGYTIEIGPQLAMIFATLITSLGGMVTAYLAYKGTLTNRKTVEATAKEVSIQTGDIKKQSEDLAIVKKEINGTASALAAEARKNADALLEKTRELGELRGQMAEMVKIKEELASHAAWRHSQETEDEQRIRRTAEELAAHKLLVEGAATALVEANATGRIVSWSAPAAMLFGWSHEEALQSEITLFTPLRFRDMHLAAFAAAARERKVFEREWLPLSALTKHGLERPVLVKLRGYVRDDGEWIASAEFKQNLSAAVSAVPAMAPPLRVEMVAEPAHPIPVVVVEPAGVSNLEAE